MKVFILASFVAVMLGCGGTPNSGDVVDHGFGPPPAGSVPVALVDSNFQHQITADAVGGTNWTISACITDPITGQQNCWWSGLYLTINTPRNTARTTEGITVSHWYYDAFENDWYWLTDSTGLWENEVWYSGTTSGYKSKLWWHFADPYYEYWEAFCTSGAVYGQSQTQASEACSIFVAQTGTSNQTVNSGSMSR